MLLSGFLFFISVLLTSSVVTFLPTEMGMLGEAPSRVMEVPCDAKRFPPAQVDGPLHHFSNCQIGNITSGATFATVEIGRFTLMPKGRSTISAVGVEFEKDVRVSILANASLGFLQAWRPPEYKGTFVFRMEMGVVDAETMLAKDQNETVAGYGLALIFFMAITSRTALPVFFSERPGANCELWITRGCPIAGAAIFAGCCVMVLSSVLGTPGLLLGFACVYAVCYVDDWSRALQGVGLGPQALQQYLPVDTDPHVPGPGSAASAAAGGGPGRPPTDDGGAAAEDPGGPETGVEPPESAPPQRMIGDAAAARRAAAAAAAERRANTAPGSRPFGAAEGTAPAPLHPPGPVVETDPVRRIAAALRPDDNIKYLKAVGVGATAGLVSAALCALGLELVGADGFRVPMVTKLR